VPVKALFSIKRMKLAAIAENCLRNKIAEQIPSIINPDSSVFP
jgi:hypothetical protein